jgi:hypothetical protein
MNREHVQQLAYDRDNRPHAAEGLTSYRYRGRYGYIMIGATNDTDALNEANRSLSVKNATIDNLDRWQGTAYVPVTGYRLDYPFNGCGTTAVIPQSQSNDHTDPRPAVMYHENLDGGLQQVGEAPSLTVAKATAAYCVEWYARRGIPIRRPVVCIAGRCLSLEH